jgi:hypothetical protein
VDFIYSVYPCSVEISRESILILWSFYTLFTLCPLRQKGGVYVSFLTGNVFLTSLVIFVPEWPKGEFVSFWLASFCWQNQYYAMLLLSQGCRIFQNLQIFRVYFSDVEIVVLWQVASVTSFMKAISVFKEDSVQIPTQRSRIPSNRPDDVVFPSGRSSVSNIHPDNENFPFGRPSVSRNFEQFKIASFWT